MDPTPVITQTAEASAGSAGGNDLVVALVGALAGVLAGAIVTTVLGGLSGYSASRRRESSALRFLVSSLAQRRAFRPRPESEASEGEDRRRLIQSIIASRDLANETRKELRPKSYAWDQIITVIAECNGFLERVEDDPASYRTFAHALAEDLAAPLTVIITKQKLATSERNYLPGSLAYPSSLSSASPLPAAG